MILAIDCGSTNHKVALFDAQLRRLAECAKPLTYTVRGIERVEFEPKRLWDDTVQLIRQACASARVSPRKIQTIAIASQAQTFTLLDAAEEPLLPFLSWADKRAWEESVELKEQLGRSFHRHCSFPSPLPQLQLCKLLWLGRNLSALPPRFKVVSLPSFLALRLAGLHLSDSNSAAMNGLYSLELNDWWPAAMTACSLEREHCGEVVKVGTAVAAHRHCCELDFSSELRIVLAGNDQTAGAYANNLRSGELVLTLGTALVAYRFAGTRSGPFSPSGCWGPYPGGGFYELLACDEGCAALDWAVAQMTPGRETEFFRAAAIAQPAAALFDPKRRYTAEAWSGQTDIPARARAVLEAICFSFREMLENSGAFYETQGHAISQPVPLSVIGGGSASALWLQMLANVLNRPLRRGQGDNLLGSAMLPRPAPAVIGEKCVTRIDPQPALVQEYDGSFRRWQQHRRV